jgi:PQQ-dependent dehydrogenase (methanol/ethanol family)
LAYHNGKIFLNTLDMYTIALDAKTGREEWRTKLGEINRGETITMAPMVVKGKVLVGNSGGELGVRGWLTALDESSGEIAWRAYGTGPDRDVLIGPDFKPYYSWMKGEDLGVKSWPADAWKIGGATFWGWLQYDPDLNLIYYGTANAGPWNADQRPGDNLWSTTIFARDPDTGMAKWADQLNPHDLWDYDEINESILLDLPISGRTIRTMLHVARNGYVYVMDRTTGKILSADPYETINSTKGIDLETGRPIRRQCLSCRAGWQGLAAVRLFSADKAALRASPAPVHELEILRGGLHFRYALCRSHGAHVCRPRRLSGRIHGMGPDRPEKSLVDQGRLAGVERYPSHGGRRGVLRDDGSLVQSSRCQ